MISETLTTMITMSCKVICRSATTHVEKGNKQIEKRNRMEIAFHSNLLSLIAIIPLSFISGEVHDAFAPLSNASGLFLLGFLCSGAVTLLLVSSSFWVISCSNGATLSFLGGLNKVPIVIFGYFLFGAELNPSLVLLSDSSPACSLCRTRREGRLGLSRYPRVHSVGSGPPLSSPGA